MYYNKQSSEYRLRIRYRVLTFRESLLRWGLTLIR